MDTDRNTAKLPAKEQLEVRLPLPPYALSPNSRTHWGTRARLIAQCRGEAKWRALEALGYEYNLVPLFPAGTVVRITAGAYRPKGRQRMDDDNFKATCKAYLDGFTDAGVWADDRQARWGEVTWGIEEVWGGRAEGGVLLTLTAEED